jgi:hypothetical protein
MLEIKLSILDFNSLLFKSDRFLLCSMINGINDPINIIITITRRNNDAIDEDRLLNLSFDLRNDENGLNINVNTIETRI